MKRNTKKERFLAVALKLIHKKGFKATTMRDISKELNCEVANIYNYVDSKQSLLEEYLFGIQDEFHNDLDHILSTENTAPEKLRLVISSYIQITAKRPYEQSILVNEWRNLKDQSLEKFIARREDYESKLLLIITKGIDNGIFRNLNPRMTTQTILAMLRNLHNEYVLKKSSINPLKTEKQVLDFIFNGIASNK